MNAVAKVQASGLSKTFTVGNQQVAAVKDVSFEVFPGETLAVVGESGCGKTTLGRMLALLLEPSAGTIAFDGGAPVGWGRRDLKPLRRNVQMVFQDPVSSLNPRHTVETILTEPLKNFRLGSARERRERASELLEAVGLAPTDLARYPHEFSGGQRQRITLARALALNPGLIVADEPVSALDVSVQSQVLNLMADLRDRHELTYLFISHDLAVVHHLANRIAVMYLGRIVEVGTYEEICDHPRHPYTQALVSAIPVPDPVVERRRKRIVLEGDVPSPLRPPSGCPFHTRCPAVRADRCDSEAPTLRALGDRRVSCHHVEDIGDLTGRTAT